ncbi:MAG: HNH endonuclease [Verrucomicrobiota bacterium]|nr:HNH endonuclease [Verrucomicrobiota bacterium]
MIDTEEQLVHVAKHDPSSSERRSALVRLRDMRSAALRPLIIEILQTELTNQNLRETAIKALGDVGTEEDIPLLRSIADGGTVEPARFGRSAAQKAALALCSRFGQPANDIPTRKRASITSSTRYKVFQRDDHRCVCCGRRAQNELTLHVDHIVPVSRGGANSIDNLQTLCDQCNQGKSDRDTRDLRTK